MSKRLKELGFEIINHQNEAKFDIHVFDTIDTEEKAYWLGFIYADGYVGYSSEEKRNYLFELSLKSDDLTHLHKFASFISHTNPNIVKVENVYCGDILCQRCRISFRNKHFWETLNSKGCVPRKSLILKFPDISIFTDLSLIRHFIRGYVDGDGCLTWGDSEHKKPFLSILGTKDLLEGIRKYSPVPGHLRKDESANVY